MEILIFSSRKQYNLFSCLKKRDYQSFFGFKQFVFVCLSVSIFTYQFMTLVQHLVQYARVALNVVSDILFARFPTVDCIRLN